MTSAQYVRIYCLDRSYPIERFMRTTWNTDSLVVAEFEGGSRSQVHAGSLHYIPPVLHDSWVFRNARYVSLHLLGADQYGKE